MTSFWGTNSLIDIVRERACRFPSKQAFRFLSNRGRHSDLITREDLDKQTCVIGGFLQEVCQPGDRVVLFCPPGREYIAAFLGCLYAGVVAVPLYPPGNQKRERVLGVIQNCGARLCLNTEKTLAATQKVLEVGQLETQVRMVTISSISQGYSQMWRATHPTSDSIAFLQYTSGSTGAPKGVMVSHGNLMANQEMIARAFHTQEGDVGFNWLPPYHDMGLIGSILQPLYAGITSILMPPIDFIRNPLLWLECITQYGASISGAPNFAYNLVLDRLDEERAARLDLNSWRIAFSGAEPVRADTMRRFSKRFGSVGFRYAAFCPCYGMADFGEEYH